MQEELSYISTDSHATSEPSTCSGSVLQSFGDLFMLIAARFHRDEAGLLDAQSSTT